MKCSSHHVPGWVFAWASTVRAPLPPFQTPPGRESLRTCFGIFLHGRPVSSRFIYLAVHGFILLLTHRHLVSFASGSSTADPLVLCFQLWPLVAVPFAPVPPRHTHCHDLSYLPPSFPSPVLLPSSSLPPSFSLSYQLSGAARYSKLILCALCLSPGISRFFKEPGFFYWRGC